MTAHVTSPPSRSAVVFSRAMLVLVSVAMAFAIVPARARAAATAPPDYITAGVGADEVERVRSREREFNLKLVFTLVEGNYLADVAVVVKDRSGNPVLVAQVDGPVLLAKLPRGVYVVDTTYEGRTQSRKVEVGERFRTEYLRWASNPETDFPGPKRTEKE